MFLYCTSSVLKPIVGIVATASPILNLYSRVVLPCDVEKVSSEMPKVGQLQLIGIATQARTLWFSFGQPDPTLNHTLTAPSSPTSRMRASCTLLKRLAMRDFACDARSDKARPMVDACWRNVYFRSCRSCVHVYDGSIVCGRNHDGHHDVMENQRKFFRVCASCSHKISLCQMMSHGPEVEN